MATMTEIPEMVDRETPYHDYHAEAHVLKGHLKRPIEQEIEEHAPVSLQDRRGGHFTRYTEIVSIEGLITFKKGKTRVSGSRSLKHNGWITLSTSILEGLNAFEVITADRIVSQVSTDHPFQDGHFPHVTFLGTQFNNLAVSGFPVTLKLNFGICGKRPDGNLSYLQDATFLGGVRDQTAKIAKAHGLPQELKKRFEERLENVDKVMTTRDKPSTDEPRVVCSLVESIGEIPIPGVTSYGHVLVIPEFGSVSLGEIAVGQKNYDDSEKPGVYFELTSIKLDMGCVAHGTLAGPTATANGRTKP